MAHFQTPRTAPFTRSRRLRHPMLARCLRLEILESRQMLDGVPDSQTPESLAFSSALFVANEGQWSDDSIRFLRHDKVANVAFTDVGADFQVLRPKALFEEVTKFTLADRSLPSVLATPQEAPTEDALELRQFSVRFVDANPVSPIGIDQSASEFNYLIGDASSRRMAVPGYRRIAYRDLYQGIDGLIEGQQDRLKYEFHVSPGADYRKILVQYEGIADLSLADDGSLQVELGNGWGSLTDDAPYIYQFVDGQAVEVSGRFVLRDRHRYSFEITGPFDTTVPLIIDPALSWSTYLGGSAWEGWGDVAVDGSGSILVTGSTWSAGWVSGGFDDTQNGRADTFVTKLSPDGTHLWSTYLGGSKSEKQSYVAVDATGNVFVTGSTESSNWVSGGFDTIHGGDGQVDGFVAKLSATGAHLWSTYLGDGTWNADSLVVPSDIQVDRSGNVVLAGFTNVAGWAVGGDETSYNGGDSDAFVIKISHNGSRIWSTYLGGDAHDSAAGIAVSPLGNIVVTGRTLSKQWVEGGFDLSQNGDFDSFVVSLSAEGAHLWSTYLGGDSWDRAYGVATDPLENVIVTGETWSTDWMAGGYDTSHDGQHDGFALKLTPSGTLLWSTFFGGKKRTGIIWTGRAGLGRVRLN